jgi:CRP-like cAMP-binding protein
MNARTRTFYGHFFSPPFLADDLFHGLPPSAKDSLESIRKSKRFNRNSTVFAAGDLPCCICMLSSGQARLTVTNGINKTTNVRLVKTGELLGLNEFLANSFCQTNVVTITPCVFECFDRKDFLDFLKCEPSVCVRLLRLLSANIQSSYDAFAESRF